jgi:hypothetical protein
VLAARAVDINQFNAAKAACAQNAQRSFLMKTKRVFIFGLPAVLLALSLVLTGCGGDDEGDDKGITGQTTVTGNDLEVSGTGMPDAFGPQTGNNGEIFSIAGGKLSFTLPAAPANPKVLSSHQELQEVLFGDGSDATATPDDAKFVMVNGFHLVNEGTNYLISKGKTTGDLLASGSMSASKIVYVHADNDVVLSRDAKEWTTDSGMSVTYHWGAVNLALKQGWNLVRLDAEINMNGSSATANATVKIATTDDVPWTIEVNE